MCICVCVYWRGEDLAVVCSLTVAALCCCCLLFTTSIFHCLQQDTICYCLHHCCLLFFVVVYSEQEPRPRRSRRLQTWRASLPWRRRRRKKSVPSSRSLSPPRLQLSLPRPPRRRRGRSHQQRDSPHSHQLVEQQVGHVTSMQLLKGERGVTLF